MEYLFAKLLVIFTQWRLEAALGAVSTATMISGRESENADTCVYPFTVHLSILFPPCLKVSRTMASFRVQSLVLVLSVRKQLTIWYITTAFLI